MNFLEELKDKPEIQRQAFFVRANQIVRSVMKRKRRPDEDWERMMEDSDIVTVEKYKEPEREEDNGHKPD